MAFYRDPRLVRDFIPCFPNMLVTSVRNMVWHTIAMQTILKFTTEACVFDIKSWMCTTMLKMNQDNIELIVFVPKHKGKSLTKLQFNFDGAMLSESSCVRKPYFILERNKM